MIILVGTRSFWIKIIWVSKNHRTSDQTHKNRTEYHIPIPSFWKLKTILPLERHRMTPGLYIEYAAGNPEEEDIIRHEDDYGR